MTENEALFQKKHYAKTSTPEKSVIDFQLININNATLERNSARKTEMPAPDLIRGPEDGKTERKVFEFGNQGLIIPLAYRRPTAGLPLA